MPMFKKLAVLATAAEAARRYARKNPDKASKFVDQAAQFVDKQTKGKYSTQISGAARKAKSAAGVDEMPGAGPTGNGYAPGQGTTYGSQPTQPGQPYPGTPTP